MRNLRSLKNIDSLKSNLIQIWISPKSWASTVECCCDFNFIPPSQPMCTSCDYFEENTIKSQTSQGWLKSIDKLTKFELQNVKPKYF